MSFTEFRVRTRQMADGSWEVHVLFDDEPWAVTRGPELHAAMESAVPYMTLAAIPDPLGEMLKGFKP